MTCADRYSAGPDVVIYEADHGAWPSHQPVVFGAGLADPADYLVPGRPAPARQPQVSRLPDNPRSAAYPTTPGQPLTRQPQVSRLPDNPRSAAYPTTPGQPLTRQPQVSRLPDNPRSAVYPTTPGQPLTRQPQVSRRPVPDGTPLQPITELPRRSHNLGFVAAKAISPDIESNMHWNRAED